MPYKLTLDIKQLGDPPSFESFPNESPGIVMNLKNETKYSFTLPKIISEEDVDVQILYKAKKEYISIEESKMILYDESNKVIMLTEKGKEP